MKAIDEMVLANRLERQANKAIPTPTTKPRQSINDFQVDTVKQYSAVNITNAVEKVMLNHGLLKKDSYEMNSFLMDVLSDLGHYK